MADRPSIPCSTLGSAGDEDRAQREDPASLHFLSRRERAAYEAVQFYLRRDPRATELRACKDLDIDFELYLEAKGKAVAGPNEWRSFSSADLIRPGHPLLTKVAPLPGRKGPPRRCSTIATRLDRAEMDRMQDEAIETVRAWLDANPGGRVADACAATGVSRTLYHTAVKRRRRLRKAEEEAS